MIHSARFVKNGCSVVRRDVRRAMRHAPSILGPLCVLAGLPESLYVALPVFAAQMRHRFLKQIVGRGFHISVQLIIAALVAMISICLLLRLVAHALLTLLGRPGGWHPEQEAINEPPATRLVICRDDATTGCLHKAADASRVAEHAPNGVPLFGGWPGNSKSTNLARGRGGCARSHQ